MSDVEEHGATKSFVKIKDLAPWRYYSVPCASPKLGLSFTGIVSVQHPSQHPESQQIGHLCPTPMPYKDGCLFGLFNTTALIGTDPRNATQIGVNERIGLTVRDNSRAGSRRLRFWAGTWRVCAGGSAGAARASWQPARCSH